ALTTQRRTALVVAVAAVVVVIDQLTKTWAAHTLATRDIDLVWTLRLHLARNRGAAFSLGFGSGGVIAILAIVVVIVFLVVGRSVNTKWGVLSLGLVLGGAVGKIVDDVVVAKGSQRVEEGSSIEIAAAPAPSNETLAPDNAVTVNVVYADDDVLVVDKPAGLVVHPGAGHRTGTLVQGLLARYPEM